jgi:hypothetical protein
MPESLKQKQDRRAIEIDQNRAIGVIDYKSNETQSREVWEVTDGLKYLPAKERGGKQQVLGPGNRFHPTTAQVEQTRRGKGGLLGKARELTATEMGAFGRRAVSAGADIGLRSLPMTQHALSLALEFGLTEDDFRGIEPDGDRITKAQVEELIAFRQAA